MTSAPGRRRAAAPVAEQGGGWRSVLGPLLVVAVALTLVAWSSGRDQEQPAPLPAARPVAVDDVTVLCRSVDVAAGGRAKAGVAVGLLPEAGGDGEIGARRLSDPDDDGRLDLPATDEPGAWTVTTLDDPAASMAVSARGGVAAALGAWRSGVADGAGGGGLALSRCASPSTDAWFLGAGSTIDHASTILVGNPGQTPAVFDVTLLSDEGELAPVSTQGIALPPGDEQVIELSGLVAGRDDVGVHVRTSEGRVVASVLDAWTQDLRPAGTEWIPAAAPAATELSLTGVPAGTVGRELLVANTGDRTTVVDVQVVGPDTTLVAEKLTELEVPAGSVTTVDVPGSLGRDAVGLRLSADQPLLAAVRARTDPGRSGDGRRDLAYTVATPAIEGPTMVPVRLGVPDEPLVPQLSLTGTDPEAAGTVGVTAYDDDGTELSSTEVAVPAGTTTTLDPSRGELRLRGGRLDDTAYLVVTPVAGTSVQASAAYTTSQGRLSVLPLTTPPTTVLAPAARPALTY